MSRKNPLYFIWPVLTLVVPAFLLNMLVMPTYRWGNYTLADLLWGWLHVPVKMFAQEPLLTCMFYGALLVSLFWWLRAPRFLSGLILLLVGFFTGPAGEATLWILFSGKIGHS